MRHRHLTRRLNYRRVLVAVYLTADDEGLLNEATNAEIGRVAGLSADTVSGYLDDLERAGVVAIFRGVMGGRYLVLLDHPDAEKAARRLRRSGEWVGPRPRRMARQGRA